MKGIHSPTGYTPNPELTISYHGAGYKPIPLREVKEVAGNPSPRWCGISGPN